MHDSLPPGLKVGAVAIAVGKPTPYTFLARREAGMLTLRGYYPDPDTRAAMQELIRERFFGEQVIDKLRYADGAPRNYLAGVTFGLEHLARLASGELAVSDDGSVFAEQAIEISAQAGQMVGVEKEERLATPLGRSLRLRHPWLQINLLTAFVAAAVVGIFEDTLARLVILAVFLPVMAGQTGNTGCQALAVTLRGMTLGELKPGLVGRLVAKEGMLGLCNGVLVGLTDGEESTVKSFRNLRSVSVMHADDVGVADVIGHARLVISEAALTRLSEKAASK